MERFAKRKVNIMLGRSGNYVVFFVEDSGIKHFVAEYNRYYSKDMIMLDVKKWWYRYCKEHLSSVYGSMAGGNNESSD